MDFRQDWIGRDDKTGKIVKEVTKKEVKDMLENMYNEKY